MGLAVDCRKERLEEMARVQFQRNKRISGPVSES